MNKYKTFEELKEELGDKFEDYMYKANIELLNKLDKIKEYIQSLGTQDGMIKDYMIDKNIKETILELLEEIE